MSAAQRTAVVRFARVVFAGALAAVIAAVPALFDLVPAEYAFVAVPALTALLAALDKLRRYGNDPGEA